MLLSADYTAELLSAGVGDVTSIFCIFVCPPSSALAALAQAAGAPHGTLPLVPSSAAARCVASPPCLQSRDFSLRVVPPIFEHRFLQCPVTRNSTLCRGYERGGFVPVYVCLCIAAHVCVYR